MLSNVAFNFNLRRYITDKMKKYITTLYYLPVDGSAQQYGKAAQVEPIKPALKAPGTKRLKL